MEATGPDPENEQELRARIRAGSRALEDYRALADILLDFPGRENEGLAVLEQAIELPLPDIQRASILAEMGWFLYELGRMERAINMAQRALTHVAQQAETPEILMVRGLSHATLAQSQHFTDRAASDQAAQLALEALEQFLGEHPTSEDFTGACLHAAGVYMLRGEYAKAVTLYEKAMQSDPAQRTRLRCLVWIGSALRSDSRYAQAEDCLKRALTLVEADRRVLPNIHLELGKVYRLTSRPEEATVAFEQGLAVLDVNPLLRADRDFVTEIAWELGYLYYEAKRHGEAINSFREVLRRLPGESYPYYNTLVSLGQCYLATGQYVEARECYEEALAAEHASKEEKEAAQEGLSHLPPLPPRRVH
jgi:tetratricopeptide (TPR) repeat protein